MKTALTILLALLLLGCSVKKNNPNKLVGTWKMVYAEMVENDSLKVKDLANTTFIKIINKSHFSFFNQENGNPDNFYSGAGTYKLDGDDYVETLVFTSVEAIKNHEFPFKVRINGDTLVQSGLEEVKAAGIHRQIVEKYVKIR